MNAYLNYLLEANLGLTVFVIAYLLLLRRETDFKAGRVYLLIAIVTSLLFPLFHFTRSGMVPSLSTLIPPTWLPEFTVTADGQARTQKTMVPVSVWSTINKVYLVGVAVFFLRFLMRLTALLLKMRWSATYPYGKYRVVESNENSSSFSFFNFIFIGQAGQLSEQDKQQIIRHESIHAKQFHSVDILLIHVLGILFWFNPVLIVYRKIFIQLHEFEADARAVEEGDANDYCNLMARVALLSADIRLANHFSNSLTLKRIQMIRTIRTRIVRWKFAAIGLMFLAFFVMVACQDQVSKTETVMEKTATEEPNAEEPVFMVVEESAAMPGGVEALGKFLSENLRYPAEARQQGKEGTVYVKFIVNKDGTLSDFEVMKGVDEQLDKEAVRVAALMPGWTPGRQQGKPIRQRFVLPIKFKLNNSTTQIPVVAPMPVKEAIVTEVVARRPGDTAVAGTITDAEGNPLLGANIIIKGTSSGTITDKHGNFSIDVGDKKGELVVSFVGYEPAFIPF